MSGDIAHQPVHLSATHYDGTITHMDITPVWANRAEGRCPRFDYAWQQTKRDGKHVARAAEHSVKAEVMTAVMAERLWKHHSKCAVYVNALAVLAEANATLRSVTSPVQVNG